MDINSNLFRKLDQYCNKLEIQQLGEQLFPVADSKKMQVELLELINSTERPDFGVADIQILKDRAEQILKLKTEDPVANRITQLFPYQTHSRTTGDLEATQIGEELWNRGDFRKIADLPIEGGHAVSDFLIFKAMNEIKSCVDDPTKLTSSEGPLKSLKVLGVLGDRLGASEEKDLVEMLKTISNSKVWKELDIPQARINNKTEQYKALNETQQNRVFAFDTLKQLLVMSYAEKNSIPEDIKAVPGYHGDVIRRGAALVIKEAIFIDKLLNPNAVRFFAQHYADKVFELNPDTYLVRNSSSTPTQKLDDGSTGTFFVLAYRALDKDNKLQLSEVRIIRKEDDQKGVLWINAGRVPQTEHKTLVELISSLLHGFFSPAPKLDKEGFEKMMNVYVESVLKKIINQMR